MVVKLYPGPYASVTRAKFFTRLLPDHNQWALNHLDYPASYTHPSRVQLL